MILDTSAILAVVFKEPEFEVVLDKIAAADVVAIGTPIAAEAGILVDARLGAMGRGALTRLLHEWAVSVVPFGENHWKHAADAYARFGGHHKAALNFGDCLS
jgi:ribonuclease VapC